MASTRSAICRLSLLLPLILGLCSAVAETLYVDDDAPGDPGPQDPLSSDPLEDGSLAHPFDAIQEAIDASTNGDIIEVLPGRYVGPPNRDLDFDGKDLNLICAAIPGSCLIDLEGQNRPAFFFDSPLTNQSVVDGFVIAYGKNSIGSAITTREGSNPIIRNCIIRDMQSDAAISLLRYHGAVINCLICNNVGEALRCSSSDVQLINCTMANNSGGIRCWRGNITIRNSIIWGNLGPNLIEVTLQYGATADIAYSNLRRRISGVSRDADSVLNWGAGNIDADPLFLDTTQRNYRLSPRSRCVNRGAVDPGILLPNTDLDLGPRVDSPSFTSSPQASIDMGAYEVHDCNSNGFADSEDIDAGLELDCNRNRVPDSCEIARSSLTDASSNGIPDACDDYLRVPEDYSLQGAIDAARDGDIIEIRDGRYVTTGYRNVRFRGKAVHVRSRNGPLNCTIDCFSYGRAFILDQGEDKRSIIEGLAIRYGRADEGGGIYLRGSSPTIRDCRIGHCTATGWGGGIFGGRPTIERCVFGNNTALDGGAIGSGESIVRDSIFVSNRASGAAIASLAIDDSITLDRCIIEGNTGGSDLFYCDHAGSVQVSNSVITNNTTGYNGIFFLGSYSSLELRNCTVYANNTTQSSGESLAYAGLYSYISMINTIARNNRDMFNRIIPSISGFRNAEIAIKYSVIPGASNAVDGGNLTWGPGNIVGNPMIDATGQLTAGSRSIDAGITSGYPAPPIYDVRGNLRTVDDPGTPDSGAGPRPRIDIGAFEYQPDCNSNGIADAQDIGQATSLDCDGNHEPDECQVCGDLDNDADVDGDDYAEFRGAYGRVVGDPQFDACVDYDDNGAIGIADFQHWMSCYREYLGDASAFPPWMVWLSRRPLMVATGTESEGE